MTRRLLMLGAGLFQAAAIRQVAQSGLEVIAADKNPAAPGFSHAPHSVAVDIVDADAVEAAARRFEVHGIMPLNDFAVPAAAAASERLGLVGISPSCARKATDKGHMRDAWEAAGLAQPRYRVVTDADAATRAAQHLGFPCIIKPAYSGGGGRGVRILNAPGEVGPAFHTACRLSLTRRVLVEDFVDGIEMTVESLGDGVRTEILAMSDKIKPPLRSRVATDLFYPAVFDDAVLARCRALVLDALAALDLRIGAGHTELIVTPEGKPFLVECGARGGGGHIFSHIVQWCSGVAMPSAWARLLVGLDAAIAPTRTRAAIYHFFCPPPGRLVAIEGIEEAARLPGVAVIGTLKQPGERIPPLDDSLQRSGYLVIQAETRPEAEACLLEVQRRVCYRVDPGMD